MPEFVTPSGAPWVPVTGQKVRAKREPEPAHMGWRVEGHPPGVLEAARTFSQKASADWLAMDDVERAAALKAGKREPSAWDEAVWTRDTKRKPVAKPYSIPSAAETCAQLARKAGWIGVQIVELKRGSSAA